MGSLGLTNGHTSLPEKDSSDIYLVVGTDEEILDQQRANSNEWRGALTLDAYLRREYYLYNQDLTKDGGITCWMLVHQEKGSSKRTPLCGCETIRKKALVGKNGEIQEVVSHGVCSVFTPPQNRGKGYAARMMTELGKKLKGWQAESDKQALFSVLFSDIGKSFYAARGWHVFPSAHVSLSSATTCGNDLPAVRLLEDKDLAELCALDEKLIRRRMKTTNSDRSAVAIVPDRNTLKWHHAREEFIAKELFNKYPVIKGAIVGEPGSRVWCFWTRVWTKPQEEAPNTFHILRLAIEDESYSDVTPASSEALAKAEDSPTTKAIAALFAAAQAQATEWGLREVQIWNPTSTTLAAAQLLDPKAVVEQREKESITSLMWYGEGSWEGVDWICNEKYGWC